MVATGMTDQAATAEPAAADSAVAWAPGLIWRDIARGGLAGLIVGLFVAGIGGRLAMRLATLLEPGTIGSFTENAAEIGVISLGGTLSVITIGIVAGAAAGVLWVIVRTWLPGAGIAPGARDGRRVDRVRVVPPHPRREQRLRHPRLQPCRGRCPHRSSWGRSGSSSRWSMAGSTDGSPSPHRSEVRPRASTRPSPWSGRCSSCRSSSSRSSASAAMRASSGGLRFDRSGSASSSLAWRPCAGGSSGSAGRIGHLGRSCCSAGPALAITVLLGFLIELPEIRGALGMY